MDRRDFLAAAGAAGIIFPRSARAQVAGAAFRPEDFGAVGDGRTNDSAAFARLSQRLAAAGGGTVVLGAGKTYVVGWQALGLGGRAWGPQPILAFDSLPGPLTIEGNGARLLAAPGLRYGSFDPHLDRPIHHAMPFIQASAMAAPYEAMIFVTNSRGPVVIRDVELDGNLPALRIGGQYGDTGWQVPGSGIFLAENRGGETISNVFSHRHGQDGMMISGRVDSPIRSRISKFISRENGRQGLSLVGGRGYDFVDCEFSRTGRGKIASAPGAGVDIEAEGGKTNRDFSFTRCKFVDNSGAAMVADSGDSAKVRFADCRFVGTTSWAAWPKMPGFRFSGCTFAGAVVHPFPSKNPAEAAKFTNCHFTDDPALSPTRKLYFADGPCVNMGESDNILFDTCRFDMLHGGLLPWSWHAIYKDCSMRQTSPKAAMTKGHFVGHNVATGPVDTYGTTVDGSFLLNGKKVG